ncbi:MAG: CHAT domain-containing protein [Caldilineaceae bacterium]|nr:CHAT domain-containing protein [Caldilineaceae bacterium]
MQTTDLAVNVAIDHTEDGYFVRIINSPTGDGVAQFHPPYTAAELERLHRFLATGEIHDQSQERATLDLLEWGERLFRALFPGPLGSMIQSNYRFAYQERARLRLRLQINHAPELAMLPWEYLFDPVRKEFVVLSRQSFFSRYTNFMHQILPFKVEPPLRMLVVSPSPGGYPVFDHTRAWLNILDHLDHLALADKLVIERLQKPTLFDLQRRLRQKECHILHFIGHGSTNEFTGEGSLIFEDEVGRGRPVNGEHLGALLRDHFPLRLVALTACDAVRTPTTNPYLNIAAQLVRRGLPAVVATHSGLNQRATATFAQNFYAQIADFMPVDLAMNESRRALLEEGHDPAWGLPALFMRAPEGQLFTPIRKESVIDEKAPRAAPQRTRFWPSFGKRSEA